MAILKLKKDFWKTLETRSQRKEVAKWLCKVNKEIEKHMVDKMNCFALWGGCQFEDDSKDAICKVCKQERFEKELVHRSEPTIYGMSPALAILGEVISERKRENPNGT